MSWRACVEPARTLYLVPDEFGLHRLQRYTGRARSLHNFLRYNLYEHQAVSRGQLFGCRFSRPGHSKVCDIASSSRLPLVVCIARVPPFRALQVTLRRCWSGGR
eukprot:scaffold173806_cov51-Prasinocladus_malaysianus.AAC.1